MIELTILTEGPDDVAALTELFIRTGRVGTARPINSAAASTATTRDRMHHLTAYTADKKTKSGTIKIVAVVNESTLPTKIATEIASLSINDPGAPERRFALVYDPDVKTPSQFEDAVHAALTVGAPAWTLAKNGPRWTLTRFGETISLTAIPWCCDGPVLDSLPNVQNLERVLCAILAETYPAGVAYIEAWLEEIRDFRKELEITAVPTWKAAIHLWCALVDDDKTEAAVAKRFLGQLQSCAEAARRVNEENGVLPALRDLLRGTENP